MRRSFVILATTVLLMLSASPAGATVRNGGRCSDSARYALSVRRLSSTKLRVKLRITDSPAGDQWQLFGSDDGIRIFAVERVASSAGSVFFGKTIRDRAGPDTVKGAGYDVTSGETCMGTVHF